MSRRITGSFNRVEGDLEVKLSIQDGHVRDAWVVSTLYRGFERILQGKDPMDALVYVPRICGICSVAQSVAAATALASAQGLNMPRNGELATNLVLACENVADHLSHFYLFFMPDFASKSYRDRTWYNATTQRFKAIQGSASRQLLPARSEFMHLMGLLAGKWPHSLALQPGGTTRALELQEKTRVSALLFGFRQFLQNTLFADTLEQVVALDSAAALQKWMAEQGPSKGDFSHFLHIAEDLNLQCLGRATNAFMSYGAYPQQGERLFRQGIWNGSSATLDQAAIREDISHSWMQQQGEPRHPFEGVTQPSALQENAYSWCKAPRLDRQVMEVGAISRQLVNGHPLIRDLVRLQGSNVRNRVIARLLEVALVVVEMEKWAQQLRPKEVFCQHADMPQETRGLGMIEAARGSLGHWLSVRNGRLLNYQIIAPTSWNFSPRDTQGIPGVLEQALVGAPIGDADQDMVAVQHIVRSFDPCMVCTVH